MKKEKKMSEPKLESVPTPVDVADPLCLVASLRADPAMVAAAIAETYRTAALRPPAIRSRLPDERDSKTHHFVIYATVEGEVQEVDGYVTVSWYPDGAPGEIFIRMGQEHGSTIQGFADNWATGFSMLLQFGAPLEVLTAKFRYVKFEPAGPTNNPEIPRCSSLPDYVCAWLDRFFAARAVKP